MEQKHTKEPLEIVGNLVRTTLPYGGMLVGEFFDAAHQPHSEEAKANARLFVAAPALLAVAQRLLDFAAAGNAFSYPLGSLQEIEQAIAKATGSAA